MTESLYASLASTIGLVAQDRHIYDGNPPGVISNVDISIDAIMQLIGT